MFLVHKDIVRAVEDYIKPLIVRYFTSNGYHVLAKNIKNVVTVKPIVNKRYLKTLSDAGVPVLSSGGNTNISMVFIDTPTAYLTNCVNGTKTNDFKLDITQYRDVLSKTTTRESYKFTIFSVTSGENIDICPSATIQLSGISVSNHPDYPLPHNLSDMDVEQRYRFNIPYKDGSNLPGRVNSQASVEYYKNLIIEELKEHGIDLQTLTSTKTIYTFCDSVTATVLPPPVLKLYTPNRFVPINEPVKFENLLTNPETLESITVDFGDNIIKTYTGEDMLKDFFVVYSINGYKTLSITITTQNKSKVVLTYPNIVNVVSYYD
jgi:hypothetical protein